MRARPVTIALRWCVTRGSAPASSASRSSPAPRRTLGGLQYVSNVSEPSAIGHPSARTFRATLPRWPLRTRSLEQGRSSLSARGPFRAAASTHAGVVGFLRQGGEGAREPGQRCRQQAGARLRELGLNCLAKEGANPCLTRNCIWDILKISNWDEDCHGYSRNG